MMRRFVCLCLLLATPGTVAIAARPGEDDNQQRQLEDRALEQGTSPEVWFYLQNIRRYDDPKLAVRRKAEFRTAQRQRRLAAQRWFGYSNLRPTVSPVPYMGAYSPHWVGNSGDEFRWIGVGQSVRPVQIIERNQSRR